MPENRFIAMHSTAVGSFRSALDSLGVRLVTARAPDELRALGVLAMRVGSEWEAGGRAGDRADLASLIKQQLDTIRHRPTAAELARALAARIEAVAGGLDALVAVVAGEQETSLAHALLRRGEIDAYVAYADTEVGVTIDRRARGQQLAATVDDLVAEVAKTTGAITFDLPVNIQA